MARVDQALDLSFDIGRKGSSSRLASRVTRRATVTLEEGFRNAWMDGERHRLTTSSGKISAKDTGIFDVTGEGGADELIIDVTPTTDSAILPSHSSAPRRAQSVTISRSAPCFPARRSDESFVTVGSWSAAYAACTGDTLTFPFISNMGGFDTGVVLVNDSKVDGSCSLFWDGVMLTNDDDEVVVADRDMMEVDSKDQTAFILSMQNGGFQGLLSAECSFSSAYGYAYITDTGGTGAQGYLAVNE